MDSAIALILASASPRRRELLARLGMPFEVIVAQVTEFEDSTADPKALVMHNAALKADWVAVRRPGALVLGADTTVFIDGVVLNKPKDLDEARRMNINISETLENRLRSLVRDEQERRWEEENREAIARYNRRVAEEGLLSDHAGLL